MSKSKKRKETIPAAQILDESKRKNPAWRSKREQNKYNSLPRKRYMIFTEGTKTEPKYFEKFKILAEASTHDAQSAIQRNFIVTVELIGKGKNTLSLLDSAATHLDKNGVTDVNVWCVFDQDDFPKCNFDNCVSHAEALSDDSKNISFHLAWSNQCIEYWFLLHFVLYDVDNSRSNYIEVLSEHFQKHANKKYAKNDDDIFSILTFQGDPKLAIKRAKMREEHVGNFHPSFAPPRTHVFKLVEELAQYITDPEIRARYL